MQSPLEEIIDVITIVLDPDSSQPKLDIGNMSPYAAQAILQQAADSLADILAPPQISYGGHVIYHTVIEDEEE